MLAMDAVNEAVSDGGTAKQIASGLPPRQREPIAAPSDSDVNAFSTSWSSRSLWALWAAGPLQRYHILHWALDQPRGGAAPSSPEGSFGRKSRLSAAASVAVRLSRKSGSSSPSIGPALGALCRFLLRAEKLSGAKSAEADAICEGLSADSDTIAVLETAKVALPALVKAVRTTVYAEGAEEGFLVIMEPILKALPQVDVECGDSFLRDRKWTIELLRYLRASSQLVCESDFTGQRLLGVGGFGKVTVGFKKDTGRPYALKRQSTAQVIDKSMHVAALLERRVLCELHSRFVLDALYAFHDDKNLVLALRIMPGGDVHFHLKRSGALGGPALKFYLASVILGLERLHAFGIVYRDLKDRNVLLDAAGQARIADFGLAADVSKGYITGKAGTLGYHAPEQLDPKHHKQTASGIKAAPAPAPADEAAPDDDHPDDDHHNDDDHHDDDDEHDDDPNVGYTTSIDFWTLGVCAYHWSTLEMPFGPSHEEEEEKHGHKDKKKLKRRVNKAIKKGKYDDVPLITASVDCLEGFVKALLKKNEDHRLGCDAGGYAKLKGHKFFGGFAWAALEAGELPAPIQPSAEQMNVPQSIEMDMKKVKEYENQRADADELERCFGVGASKWDHVCDKTSVPKSYVEYLEKRALEDAKAPTGTATLYEATSAVCSTDGIDEIVSAAHPRDTGAAATGGGGDGGGCCLLM